MKTILSFDELISHMKEKGVRFNIMTEDEARLFLQNNNYYMKLASYRKNFSKYETGDDIGKYRDLEFAYLRELSTIDMYVRYIVMQMCLDIEHGMKVRLLNEITNDPNEDGYMFVQEYIKKEDPDLRLFKRIQGHKSGEYCKDLIEKYYPMFPIWVLVELITFGDILHLCQFYEKEHAGVSIVPNHKLMNIVRDLRNASAHSNCLMNQMLEQMDPSKQPDSEITVFVKNLGVNQALRTKYLHRNFPYNIATLFYVYNAIVPEAPRKKRYEELQNLLNTRVLRHKDYFCKHAKITGTYKFLKKVVDGLLERD